MTGLLWFRGPSFSRDPERSAGERVRNLTRTRSPALRSGARLNDAALIRQPIPHDAKERLDRVLEAYLLALLVSAAGVADGHFVDTPRRRFLLGDLRRHLRLEAETVRFELDALKHLPAENLVAGLHVR